MEISTTRDVDDYIRSKGFPTLGVWPRVVHVDVPEEDVEQFLAEAEDRGAYAEIVG